MRRLLQTGLALILASMSCMVSAQPATTTPATTTPASGQSSATATPQTLTLSLNSSNTATTTTGSTTGTASASGASGQQSLTASSPATPATGTTQPPVFVQLKGFRGKRELTDLLNFFVPNIKMAYMQDQSGNLIGIYLGGATADVKAAESLAQEAVALHFQDSAPEASVNKLIQEVYQLKFISVADATTALGSIQGLTVTAGPSVNAPTSTITPIITASWPTSNTAASTPSAGGGGGGGGNATGGGSGAPAAAAPAAASAAPAGGAGGGGATSTSKPSAGQPPPAALPNAVSSFALNDFAYNELSQPSSQAPAPPKRLTPLPPASVFINVPYSESLHSKLGAPAAPSVVAKFTTKPGRPVVSLKWTTIKGEKYSVYRSTKSGAYGQVPYSSSFGDTSDVPFKIYSVQNGSESTYLFVDEGVTVGLTYYYEVSATTKDASGYHTSPPSSEVLEPILAVAPGDVKASFNNDKVTVSWDPSGASIYEVYWKLSSGASVLIDNVMYPDNSLIFDPVLQGMQPPAQGATYNYYVKAVYQGSSGVVSSPPSGFCSVTFPVGNAPPVPQGISAVDVAGQVYLYWPDVAGAKAYNVYRSTTDPSPTGSKGISKIPLKQGQKGTNFTDGTVTPGITYYYQISAVNGSQESGKSEPVQITPKAATGTTTPTGLTAIPGNGSVTLSWDDAGATSYDVYRGPHGGSVNPQPLATGVSMPGYVDATAASSVAGASSIQYDYVVTSVGAGGQSAFSQPDTVVPAPSEPEYALTATASPGNGVIVVTWAPTLGATAYEVYRSSDGNVFKRLAATSDTNFTDGDAPDGLTYTYRIRAYIDGYWNSYYEDAVAVPSDDFTPSHAGFGLTAVPSPDKTILSWQHVPKATGYSVERYSASFPSHAPDRDVGDTTEWQDTEVTTGESITYLVTAKSGDHSIERDVVTVVTPSVSRRRSSPSSPGFGFSATPAANSVNLSWRPVPKAVEYDITRYSETDNSPSRVTVADKGDLSTVDSKLKNGTDYTYIILALGNKNNVIAADGVSAVPWSEPPSVALRPAVPFTGNDATARLTSLGDSSEPPPYEDSYGGPTVVLTGSAMQVEQANALLSSLDVPPPQVVIEAQLFELTPTAAQELGVLFNNGNGSIASTTISELGVPELVTSSGTTSKNTTTGGNGSTTTGSTGASNSSTMGTTMNGTTSSTTTGTTSNGSTTVVSGIDTANQGSAAGTQNGTTMVTGGTSNSSGTSGNSSSTSNSTTNGSSSGTSNSTTNGTMSNIVNGISGVLTSAFTGVSASGGLNFGTFTRSPLSLMTELDALITSGSAHILARPRIMVLSGQQADIFIGDDVKYNSAVGVATNGVANVQVADADIGIELTAAPTVNLARLFLNSADIVSVDEVTSLLSGAGGPLDSGDRPLQSILQTIYGRYIKPSTRALMNNWDADDENEPQTALLSIALAHDLNRAVSDQGFYWSIKPEVDAAENASHHFLSDDSLELIAKYNSGEEVDVTRLNRSLLADIFWPAIKPPNKDSITMALKPGVTTFEPNPVSLSGILFSTRTRTANTVVRLNDGEPFMIGGLMSEEDLQIMEKVPILGDLPILGALFRHKSDSSSQVELAIIITTYVRKPPSQLFADPRLYQMDQEEKFGNVPATGGK